MLRQLRVRGVAIIDDLIVRFEPGFNVLTGETGAGKSIIVDALGLALGERAQSDIIRTGRSEAIAEALFDHEEQQRMFFEQKGLPAEDDIMLRRNLLSTGKNRAYINDTLVNALTLLELGGSLVDIHSQHEHQSLFSADSQRTIVDAYGRHAKAIAAVEQVFHEMQRTGNELSVLKSGLKEKEQRTDFLKFQIGEIDAAALTPGEKETLTEEIAILSNLAKLTEISEAAYNILYGSEHALTDRLASAISLLKDIAHIDHGIDEVMAPLKDAAFMIEDAASSLRKYREGYDLEPKRLETAEDRLDAIKRLEKNYGKDIEGILKYREEAALELEGLEFSDERLKHLEAEFINKEKLLREKAAALSDLRKAASQKIEEAVTTALKELAMGKAEFRIRISPAPISLAGADHVEFLLSANKGEALKPMARVASGGELSRVMLALKGILADVDKVPVLIFDEVDAGIGGRTAEYVGIRLKGLARKHQVLCITHLPQIAAMADHHLLIEKSLNKEGVCVKVRRLSDDEREQEIARMLSGKITDISLRHARELLGQTT